jgi:phenylalanyl-tRNA synthetase beta chain
MMVTMFTHYCEEPFSVEGCDVVTAKGEVISTPNLSDNVFEADPVQINKGLGIDMAPHAMAAILSRMQLPARYDANTQKMSVRAPPTRNDVFHACDIQEDVAIAYGYNNIKKTIPTCHTEGRAQPLNKLSDQIREIVAQSGYLEVLTWILGNDKEHFEMRNGKDDGTTCVKIANQAIAEFNIVRTSLIPGLLKTMHHNYGRVNLPVKIFELSDVVLKDATSDVGARNKRRLGALFCGNVSGFEVIHGLLDKVMAQLGAVFKLDRDAGNKQLVYEIRKSDDPGMFSWTRS